MSGAPETTNTLLLWLIVATALTPVLMIAAGITAVIYIKRAVAQMQSLTARLEADLRPLMTEAQSTLAQVQHIAAAVRRRVDEVDRGVDTLQDKTVRITESLQQILNGTLGRVLSILRPMSSRRAS